MKIVIAPDSFKESLSAMEAAEMIEQGFQQVFPDAEYCKVPLADGGEGTVQAMVDATNGQIMPVLAAGPRGNQVEAFFGVLGDKQTAVIEMAAASGLHLVEPALRDPRKTSSYGTGELISAALDAGASKLIIGLGGSATNDAGVGMLQALGAQFYDKFNKPLKRGGAELIDLESIDISGLDPRLADVDIEVACDVDNPLCGEHGASAVFGPQKGASPEMIRQLDAALGRFSSVVFSQFGIDIMHVAGSGAAGGMGAALLAFMQAELRPGVQIVTEAVDLAASLEGADLLITGEGRIDSQTIAGKTPYGAAQIAMQFEVPVIALAGAMLPGYEVVHEHGIDAVFSVVPGPCDLSQALSEAEQNLFVSAKNVAATLKLSQQMLG
ncbi:glycerate kinase [Agarivorans sp. OAG1]|uniref:glycerate kinase n=1 Tax=unclassified Agarivorans TaxID=2636026 RepID=UPI00128B5F55|nr:glycerate kinase [Agarivorans sp. B2Z047]MPW29888.1 glycerate kinase [Agarivorans sp. B2Z047]UQN43456.1 glycerate kinase [Agarivorans sp. B2Z047]BEU04996.1 glycerate kinase [Agarivorans sp. OAG1]